MKHLIIVLFLMACNDNTCQMGGIVIDVKYYSQRMSWASPDITKTIVTFKDGRVRAFEGISRATFYKNKLNIIEYRCNYNRIRAVYLKPQQ